MRVRKLSGDACGYKPGSEASCHATAGDLCVTIRKNSAGYRDPHHRCIGKEWSDKNEARAPDAMTADPLPR